MAKTGRGALTADEAKIVKALLAKGWRNQDIQALVNFGRKATVNSARITGVKQSRTIEPADNDAVEFFRRKKKSYDPRTGLNLFEDERLIRAREAMALAVQIFNSPTLNFKTEVFAVLVNVAWTYLLHEFYMRRGETVIDPETHNAWLLSQMTARADCPLTPGMKQNLASMKTIRDSVEHTLLGKSDQKWLTLFQACCLNFDKVMRENFGEDLSLQHELAFALQFARLSVEQIVTLHKYDVPEHIEALDARLKEGMTEEQLADLDYQFRVVYTLNSASKAQSHIQFISPGSEEGREIHNVLARYRSADETHPYKPQRVIELVNERSEKTFSSHNHTQAWKKFKCRPPNGSPTPQTTTPQFCIYHKAHKDYTYSEDWVSFLVDQISTDEGFANIRSQKV